MTLVDTQFKVSHEFIAEVGLEIDQMNLSSAEEHAPIIDKLKKRMRNPFLIVEAQQQTHW